jgi:cysteinyl-tRNA synthetase
MNITDVGHLTGDNEGDASVGEDRMEKGARKEGITAWDVAQKFLKIYTDDLHEMRIDPFSVMPKATDHIPQQITMIQELEANGLTYVLEGDGVYMNTGLRVDENGRSLYGALLSEKHVE